MNNRRMLSRSALVTRGALAAAGLLGFAALGHAQGGRPGTAPSGDVFSSSNCQTRYQTAVKDISAQHTQEAQRCKGDSLCIKSANQRAASAEAAENKKLYLCQRSSGESPTTTTPPTSTQPWPPISETPKVPKSGPSPVDIVRPPSGVGGPPARRTDQAPPFDPAVAPNIPPTAPGIPTTPPTSPSKPPAKAPTAPTKTPSPPTWTRPGGKTYPAKIYKLGGKEFLFPNYYRADGDMGDTWVIDAKSLRVQGGRGNLLVQATAMYVNTKNGAREVLTGTLVER